MAHIPRSGNPMTTRSERPILAARAKLTTAPAAHAYSVFGGVLRSRLMFPELLPSSNDDTDWNLYIGDENLSPEAGRQIGERRVGSELYRLLAGPAGYQLSYSGAGRFDISRDGRAITWFPTSTAKPELARWIVLGPALGLALEATGHLCLHGSAVAIGERAIGFIAPKHHGKSTIAVALTTAGATFVGDDTLAVTCGAFPTLRPGIPAVRLWKDAARSLDIGRLCNTVFEGVKTTATGFSAQNIRRAPVPLSAIYVLEPVPYNENEPPVQRRALSLPAAAAALAQHAKLPDTLVGLAYAGHRLRRAATLAMATPVYSLRIARDFEQLPAVVSQILDWHGGGAQPGRA